MITSVTDPELLQELAAIRVDVTPRRSKSEADVDHQRMDRPLLDGSDEDPEGLPGLGPVIVRHSRCALDGE